MISNTLRRSMMGSRMQMASVMAVRGPKEHVPIARNYESTRGSDASRHMDEPEPTEDD